MKSVAKKQRSKMKLIKTYNLKQTLNLKIKLILNEKKSNGPNTFHFKLRIKERNNNGVGE
jgi:hypothetical protein